jgi:hypothetical protein
MTLGALFVRHWAHFVTKIEARTPISSQQAAGAQWLGGPGVACLPTPTEVVESQRQTPGQN